MGAKTMKIHDCHNARVKGHVDAYWSRDGAALLKATDRKNVITYRSADILARMLGGDDKFRPAYVGYLYGPNAPGVPMPNPDGAGREHTMTSMEAELLALAGNMIVSPLSANPQFIVDGDLAYYNGNGVVLSAISDNTSDLIYPAGAGYEATPPQVGADKYYQVMLLARYFEAGSIDPVFVPFARTQLAAGVGGLDVQAGSELAVFWTITFS